MMIAIAFGVLVGFQLSPSSDRYGAGLGVCAHYNDLTDSNEDGMRQAGIHFIRTDIPWSEVEHHKGTFDFSRYDPIADNLRKHHLRPLFILDYGNLLYGEETPRSAEGIEAFVRYADATVRRYKDLHPIWEIWNEPNHHLFWKPTPNAAEYARLALATAAAIRKADPDSKIAALGLTKLDWDFMKASADQGLLNDIDYVSVHTYRFVRPETAIAEYKQLQQFIEGYHPPHRVGIICTEWGYPLTYPGEDEVRAGYYDARCYLVGLMAGIDGTFLYEWNDTPMAPGQTQGHFGLHNEQGGPRPALDNLNYLESELKGYSFEKAEPPAGDVYVLHFRKGDSEKTVAWTTALDPAEMTGVSQPRDPNQSSVPAMVDGTNVNLTPVPRVVGPSG
jgi:hypothetical protein